ncbi:MAG: hypothetical protein WBC21_01870 [Minisyncoccales bacterium]
MKGSEEINSCLNKIVRIIDPAIKEILTSYVSRNNREIVNYQISAGGKRLRPALAIITCQMLGGKIKDSLKVLPQNKWNYLLQEITEFTITREK